MYSIGSLLYVVARPRTEYKLEMLPEKVRNRIRFLSSLEKITNYEPNSLFIVLETYGTRYLNEIEVQPSQDVVLVIGAEDYGLPLNEAAKLPHSVVARLPTNVEGMSYNVVSSLVMAIYELKRGRESK